MNSILRLSWRYLAHHPIRSVILVLGIALTLFLPLTVNLLVASFSEEMRDRAAVTPLLLGRQGSRYDLVLGALYFQGRIPRPLEMAEADHAQDSGLALTIPLRISSTARKVRVVGTSHDYFAFRGLRPGSGSLPMILGDAVLGSAAARTLALAVGDRLLTDRGSLYNLSAAYPLRLRVVGVLDPSGSPDDGVVFVDLKTAWILEGLGHGHAEATSQASGRVLYESEREVALNASVVEAMEITEENIDTFHFHGGLGELPLTAAIVLPRDDKSATLLKGRYLVSESAQLLDPDEVIDELLGFVLKVKRFFDANLALVSIATVLFLLLIVLLSLKVRQREIETLSRIGCARGTVFRLMATELTLILLAGVLLGGALALLLATPISRGLLQS